MGSGGWGLRGWGPMINVTKKEGPQPRAQLGMVVAGEGHSSITTAWTQHLEFKQSTRKHSSVSSPLRDPSCSPVTGGSQTQVGFARLALCDPTTSLGFIAFLLRGSRCSVLGLLDDWGKGRQLLDAEGSPLPQSNGDSVSPHHLPSARQACAGRWWPGRHRCKGE